jgi:DNA repair protein RecN (Recombination protein N)
LLRELHISNLAVIADARVELARGLNCFTGATGAGKSLVIGAIEVLLGLRNPSEMLRAGADEGRVSGVFEIGDRQILDAIARLTDTDLAGDGGELLLTRRLYASGRTSASLNGNPITLGMLKQVAEHLVDVHGQHDHQYLLKPANQLDVLDQSGNLWALRRQYHEVYQRLEEARRRLEDLSAGRTLRQQQLELYRFQAQEIDAAEPAPGEYEELQARGSVLRNLEKLTRDATATHSALYAAEGSVLERLKMMSAVLSELSILDQNLSPVAGSLRDATINLEEVAFDLSRYLDKLELDPAEIAEVEDRLNTLNRILNKYGGSIDEALQHRLAIGAQIEELEKATDDLSSLQSAVDPLERELTSLGQDLSEQRAMVAARIAPLIERQLAELGMDKARLVIALSRAPRPLPSGLDLIEFIVQTNPGLPAQPLRKIASGGEMSRIMLALKGVLAQGDRVSVLVFDEIDANVGGRLGSVIGNKLRALADHHQVLCITHLPQIACYADRHLTVRKETGGDRTLTSVRPVDGAERIEELAEMIGGPRVTETMRAQAGELLQAARSDVAAKAPATSSKDCSTKGGKAVSHARPRRAKGARR